MTDFRTPQPQPAHEPGPQPDPMLEPGRRSSGWVWLFGLAIVAIVVVTLYGVNNREPQTAANGSAAPAQNSTETTGAAPKDQQADQQNGKSGANAQKSAGGSSQPTPANSPNGAAPQKDQSGQTNQQPPKQQ